MNLNEIYLDNGSTTRVDPSVAQEMLRVLMQDFGNPSSLHKKGLDAQLLVDAARKTTAAALGTAEQTVHFTSGGTEANNLALFGAASARKRQGNKIVSTAFEHSSVMASLKELEARGFEVAYVKPEADGSVDPERFAAQVDENTILATAMLVNNELGSLLPVAEMARLSKRRSAALLFHCDCVQGFCKLPHATASGTGADLITLSGHKIHAPKGVGALYVGKGVRIAPLLYGGPQENKLRAGTENVAGIHGFGLAVKAAMAAREQNYAHVAAVRESFVQILQKMDGICINSGAEGSPYILNLSVPGIRSEIMLHFLESRGIYVSAGSACAKGAKSAALTAVGFSDARIDSALRLSFSKYNTPQEAESFAAALQEGMASIRR